MEWEDIKDTTEFGLLGVRGEILGGSAVLDWTFEYHKGDQWERAGGCVEWGFDPACTLHIDGSFLEFHMAGYQREVADGGEVKQRIVYWVGSSQRLWTGLMTADLGID